MTRWMKDFSWKYEDLSVGPQTHTELDEVVHVSNLSSFVGRWAAEGGDSKTCELASFVWTSVDKRLSNKVTSGNQYPRLFSDLNTCIMVHVCLYLHTWTHMTMYIHTHIHTIHTHSHILSCTHIHAHTYIHTCARVRAHTHTAFLNY